MHCRYRTRYWTGHRHLLRAFDGLQRQHGCIDICIQRNHSSHHLWRHNCHLCRSSAKHENGNNDNRERQRLKPSFDSHWTNIHRIRQGGHDHARRWWSWWIYHRHSTELHYGHFLRPAVEQQLFIHLQDVRNELPQWTAWQEDE